MSQVRHQYGPGILSRIILIACCVAAFPSPLCAQGYDDAFELKSKLKVELQYADYGEYEYPEPILYSYGRSAYQQNQPYIANFPERRGLIKFTRMTGEDTQLGFKYQFSDLKEDAKQHFVEGKITQTLSESVVGLISGQVLYDTRNYVAYQGGTGALWDITPMTSVQGDVQYFYRGKKATAVGGSMGTLNLRLKVRQVLTLSTAVQGEYIFYSAKGDAAKFNSHTVGFWVSQFLPTQTAIHLCMRFYTNSMGIKSYAPSVEAAQYVDWATVLWLKFRYYRNKSDNVSLGETDVIIPDGLISRSFSIQVNREMSSSVLLYGKYRYYASSLSVRMNTYLVGAVYSF